MPTYTRRSTITLKAARDRALNDQLQQEIQTASGTARPTRIDARLQTAEKERRQKKMADRLAKKAGR